MVNNVRGAFSIPCLLIAMVLVISGTGVWGLMRYWRRQVEIQLKQDRCVGEKMLELKSLLETLDSSNRRMEWERRAAAVAVLTPPALEALRAALTVEVGIQELIRLRWQTEGSIWRAGKGCGGDAGLALRFPDLNWKRPPSDVLGPCPFEWGPAQPAFVLMARKSRHSSAARVKRTTHEKNRWHAQWISASDGLLGTNLR